MGQIPDIEFAYYAFKSGKWIKQTPTPPFWGDVGVKKWSQILDSGTWSPIFGHLKIPKVPDADVLEGQPGAVMDVYWDKTK